MNVFLIILVAIGAGIAIASLWRSELRDLDAWAILAVAAAVLLILIR